MRGSGHGPPVPRPQVGPARCTLLAAGAPLVAISSLMLGIGPLGGTDSVSAAAPGVAGLAPLSSVPVPAPSDLTPYIADQGAVVKLGKALFWDMQVGSDGVAGVRDAATSRPAPTAARRTQINPDSAPAAAATSRRPATNATSSSADDFPFHKLADPNDRALGGHLRHVRRRLVAGRVQRRRSTASTPATPIEPGAQRGPTRGSASAASPRARAPPPQHAVRHQRRLQRPPVLGRPRAGRLQRRQPVRRPRHRRAACAARTPPARRAGPRQHQRTRRSPPRPSARPATRLRDVARRPRASRDIGNEDAVADARCAPGRERRRQRARPLDGRRRPARPDHDLRRAAREQAFKPEWWNSNKIVHVRDGTRRWSIADRPLAATSRARRLQLLALLRPRDQAYEATLVSDQTPLDRFLGR